MAIPLSYNLRNLSVRKTTTLMTALGIGLTVAVLLALLALVNGLEVSFQSTGHPLNVLVMRKGSTSELSSNFARAVFQDLKFKPGIAARKDGQPLASLEVVSVINLPSVEYPDGVNLNVRGVMPAGLAMREDLKIAQGRWFEEGRREVVVGRLIAERNPDAGLGRKIRFGRGEWEVVGVADGGRSAYNNEIFCDLNQLASDYNRSEVLSSALLRATDEVAQQALINSLNDDIRLNVAAQSEKGYYEAQTSTARPIQILGMFVAVIMAVGSSFAAMNTMYSAVARRSREIGTLRVVGFSRLSILVSFLIESLLVSALGGVLGCLLVLPVNGLKTSLLNFTTFSQNTFEFSISPMVMVKGIIFASVLGALGGLWPARSAARKEILTALREM
jgi:putative ABC transport system permease protein